MAQEAIAILEETFGPNDVQTLNARTHLGDHLAEAGKTDEAIVFHLETLPRVEETLGTAHPVYEFLLFSLGTAQGSHGEDVAARETLAKAVDVARVIRGPNHPQVATALSHLGDAQRKLGEFEDADLTHREALQIRRRNGTPARIAASLEALARLADDEGNLAEAAALYERAARQWAEAYGPGDENVLETRRLARTVATRAED